MVKSSPGVSPKPRFGPNLDSTVMQASHHRYDGALQVLLEAKAMVNSIDTDRRTALAARYLEKKTRRFFDLFCAPPRSCFPGFTRVDPTIDQNKRPG